ncbi:hypothetical protein QCA50_018668 [Cerrena zonata]|uniref:BUB1 N-terminal domain-containing protein n=1 Tax=Cerrena zonata TaxID=2478898 RepID=A0AAW0FGT5_9APHY
MAAAADEIDVFQDNGPPIVDCDVLEKAKENIQPIAKGRKATALSAILSTPHAQRESRLASARNRLRINVEVALEDEDDDPLDAYCRFVDWTVENYPQGHSAESGLLELLEEATRVLRNDRDGLWKDDLRYLKLWVLYASYVEKPAIIYKFCVVNEIGTSHALLYEEFAIALERAGRKSEADDTYLLGIARKAAPIERLEAKHREFQKRMLTATTLPAQAPPDAPLGGFSSSSGSKPRRVLGETSKSRSTSGTLPTPLPQPVPEEDIPPRPNARMQVFVDPSGDAEEEAAAAPWAELGTRKSRIKENVPEVSKASGTTLKQAGRSTRSATAARGSQIAVFRDADGAGGEDVDDEGDAPAPSPPAPTHSKTRSTSSSKIPVFQDKAEVAPGPSTSRTTRSTRASSKIAVLRDSEAPPPAETKKRSTRTTSSSKIAVLRDEPSAPSSSKPKGRTASTSKVPVFRDEEPACPAAPSSKGKSSKLAVFCDEEPAPAPTPSTSKPKASGSSKLSVFKDEEPSPSSSKAKPPAAPGKMAIFCDDEPEPNPVPALTSKKGKSIAPAPTKLAIFRDEDVPGDAVPATPKFTPYRDEDASPTPHHAVQGSVMKEKQAPKGVRMSSEGEALRKDPLKNYADEDRAGVVED